MISFDRESGVDVLAEAANDGQPQSAPVLGAAIEALLARKGLRAEGLDVACDLARGMLRVSGCAPNQDMRERIVLCCGNVRGVGAVDDRMSVVMPSEVSRWRFVQPGDTLARIAADLYRDARRANQLRAANQPLIGDSEELQPGWLLRVPA